MRHSNIETFNTHPPQELIAMGANNHLTVVPDRDADDEQRETNDVRPNYGVLDA